MTYTSKVSNSSGTATPTPANPRSSPVKVRLARTSSPRNVHSPRTQSPAAKVPTPLTSSQKNLHSQLASSAGNVRPPWTSSPVTAGKPPLSSTGRPTQPKSVSPRPSSTKRITAASSTPQLNHKSQINKSPPSIKAPAPSANQKDASKDKKNNCTRSLSPSNRPCSWSSHHLTVHLRDPGRTSPADSLRIDSNFN